MIDRGKLLGLDVSGAHRRRRLRSAAFGGMRPLTVITRRSRNEDFAVLAALVADEEAVAVVWWPALLTVSVADAAFTARLRAQAR
ncbi:MAG: hypothetical protein R2854_00355 [Caldilineaceae bacterium]